MKQAGTCAFCKTEGAWEIQMFPRKKDARFRKPEVGALFPWNKPSLPNGCNFSPATLARHGIITVLACPNCFRAETSKNQL